MKILIIRHGDPDYSIDSLTPQGEIEAKALAERIAPLAVVQYYVSPLGRAQKTASYTLEKAGREAITCPWMREFDGKSHRPDVGAMTLAWDWLPQDWTKEERFYDKDRWLEPEAIADGNTPKEYEWVTSNLDELLAHHGYTRDGRVYRAEKPNNDTIVFFCHFGVECVMLSHLLGVSPMVLWHGLIAAPTSVTTVVTEERRPGIASFRVTSFGDTGHLQMAGVPAAFAGRFRECYTNEHERRD